MQSKNEFPIILLPQLAPKGQRTFERVFKFSLTVLFLLILAAVTLAVWIGSGFYVQEQILTDVYIKKTWGMMITVGWLGLATFLLMLLWQQYNLRVFGKRTRRQFPPATGAAEVAKVLNVTEETVVYAQQLRVGSFCIEENQRMLYNEKNEGVLLGGIK